MKSSEQADIQTLANVVRISLVALVLSVSFINITACYCIMKLEFIFKDMLNGQELPYLTAAALRGRYVLAGVSFALPAMALLALQPPVTPKLLYGLVVLFFLSLQQISVVLAAMFLPFVSILSNMAGHFNL